MEKFTIERGKNGLYEWVYVNSILINYSYFEYETFESSNVVWLWIKTNSNDDMIVSKFDDSEFDLSEFEPF